MLRNVLKKQLQVTHRETPVAPAPMALAVALVVSMLAANASAALPSAPPESLPPARFTQARTIEAERAAIASEMAVTNSAINAQSNEVVNVQETAPALPPLAQQFAPAQPFVNTVPVKVIYVSENQPVQIVDQAGRLIQVIYLKKK